MNRLLLLIVVFATLVLPLRAQYVRVNYDEKTIAAMAAAYATETAAEAYYNEQVKKIRDSYSAAEVAAAGIFAAKYLDRKALTDLGIWNNSTENYYYRRIYKLVGTKIMPKIWTVARQMLHSPQTALYWGSYLMKICTEVKSLCMQFESVVTNSKLGFSDLTFLEINPDLNALFDLTNLNNVDWKSKIAAFATTAYDFTVADLKEDIEQIYNLGVGIATAGSDNQFDALRQSSKFYNLAGYGRHGVLTFVNNFYNQVTQLNQTMSSSIQTLVGDATHVSKLFNISSYDLKAWLTDYLASSADQYYTQRWYIYRQDSGKEQVCAYTPPTDDTSIASSDEWTRFDTSDESFTPSMAQAETIMSNSESYAGWSRAQVKQLNAANNGYRYTFGYSLLGYNIKKKNKLIQKAYAYSINVYKSWNLTDTVYTALFDSYSMDAAGFQAQMSVLLEEYNDNEEGYVYTLASEDKNYYTTTDEVKIKDCESAIISVTCNDGATLIEGTTQYKCRKCGSSLSTHTQECSMQTSVTENELDLTELDKMEADYARRVDSLQAEIDALEAENSEFLKQIAQSTSARETALLRQKYNNNKTRIDSLQSELETAKATQSSVQDAKAQAEADDAVETDDYYRIPAIMQDCKTAYSLSWQGAGSWDGYTYVREAKAPNINGIITFKATLSIARSQKHFLGIQIHRTIVNIAWKLTAEYSDTEVVDILTFDAEQTDAEKADELNQRLSEIAQNYPDCTISTEYLKREATESDASTDTYHLLWSSDRLEVAREVDTRLTKIYADLVSLEKMMNYKLSIVDVLKNVMPTIHDETGRRLTLTEQACKRWLRNAANASHSIQYNGKYDDE
jgi:hypothetical protein